MAALGLSRDRAAGRCPKEGRLTGRDSYDAKESRGPLPQGAGWMAALGLNEALEALK